ncbi:MAG: hypothetical protein ABR976_11540 [Terracidiphilus sp.]|jgi:hypothetical protein
MLNQDQIDEVWKSQISAETRSLYFADLANVYTREKQWITGASFFLSSGAAAALIGKFPAYVPLILSGLVALATAYSIALNMDSKIRTMAKLQTAWSQIADGYKRLWNHHYEDGAEAELEALQQREAEFSTLASTDAPNDPKRMGRWEDHVFRLKGLSNA